MSGDSDPTPTSPTVSASGADDVQVHSGYLRTGSLSLFGNFVIALANVGPTVSIALTLSALVAVSGYATPLAVLITAIPMLGIALAYRRLNNWHVSCGATYAWGAKAISPYFGWMTGWVMLLAYIVGTTSCALPIGAYALSIFPNPWQESTVVSSVIGTVGIVAMTAIAYVGIRATSRFQAILIAVEYSAIALLAVLGLVGIFGGEDNSEHFEWSWFSWQSMGGAGGLMSAVLIAVFMYAGWDTAISLNEETEDSRVNPGRAVIAAVLGSAVIYTVLTFALQGAVKYQALQDNGANALAYIASVLGGGWLAKVMILTVLLSALGALLASIVASGRIGFAMGFDKVLPAAFGRTHSVHKTPVNAMMIGAVIALIWTWLNMLGSTAQAATEAIVSGCGLLFALFYSATGFAVAVFYRRLAVRSMRAFFELVLFPVASAVFLLYAIWRSVPELGGWAGHTMVYLYVLMAIGLALMFYARLRSESDYFRRPREVFDPEQVEPGDQQSV